MRSHPGRLLAALTVSAALVLTGCASNPGQPTPEPSGTSEQVRGGTLTLANSLVNPTFDPTLANGGVFLQYFQAVYDSIVRRLPDGTIAPMLATSWEYNDDRTVLTLKLRDDVEFTDGTPLDAEAVKFNLDAFKAGNGPTSASLASVESVEAPDATTVILNLSAPDPSILDRLGATSGFVASPTAAAGGNLGTVPVGSGPYILDEAATVPLAEYTFTKNPDYWDPSIQMYDKVVIKVINDTTARLNAIISGQVDAALLIPKTAQQAKSAGLTETLYSSQWVGLIIRDLGGETVPELADPKVRQAIAWAIDRDTILQQVYLGLGEVTNQVFDPQTSAYVPALDAMYGYDPEKARDLLDEAGVSEFSFKMPLFPAMDPAEQAAISQNLADIGITVIWEPIAAAEQRAVLAAPSYPVVWWPLSFSSPWLTATKLIAPYANYNTFKYQDPEVDELLVPLRSGDDAEQAEAGRALNEYVTENVWFVPFIRPSQTYFTAVNTSVVPQAQESDPALYNYSPTGK